jgi:hypothetical protein
MRKPTLVAAVIVLAGTTFTAQKIGTLKPPATAEKFSVFEASIPEMQAAMK